MIHVGKSFPAFFKTLDLEFTPGCKVSLGGTKMMTIKEVSEKFNISSDTLRYYERVGMIPPVTRTSGGIRDYREEDLRWVELAICTRNAGLPIEMMIEYVSLFRKGDSTIPARLDLLYTQMEVMIKQKEQIEETMRRLSYKIERYEEALKTGKDLS